MSLVGFNDLITSLTGGKSYSSFYQKTIFNPASSAAGRWHETASAYGIPGTGGGVGVWSGTAGVATSCINARNGTQPWLDAGPAVTTDTKILTSASMITNVSTLPPASAILVDVLLYYPNLVLTTTPTTLNNSTTLPRNTGGTGVMAFAAIQTVGTAGAAAIKLTYTDDSSNTGNVCAQSLILPAATAPVSSCFHWQAAGLGVFTDLLTTDKGIKKIDSYSISVNGDGKGVIVLCKPLLHIPLAAQYVLSERDYVMQMPPGPIIHDDACLMWLISMGGTVTAASADIFGELNFAWS